MSDTNGYYIRYNSRGSRLEVFHGETKPTDDKWGEWLPVPFGKYREEICQEILEKHRPMVCHRPHTVLDSQL